MATTSTNGTKSRSKTPSEATFKAEPNTLILEDASLRLGFVQLPKQILYARNVSHVAKLLYAVLLGYAFQEEQCFPGYQRLCEDIQASENMIRKYMRELQAVGLLSQKRRGQGKTNIYILHDLRTSKIEVLEPAKFEVQKPQDLRGNNKQNNNKQNNNDVVGLALQNFGISKSAANKLAQNFPDELILEKLDLAQWLVATGSPMVAKNPAGWLRKAIEEDYAPPRNYESPKEKKAKTEQAARVAERAAKECQLAAAEFQRVRAETKQQLLAQFPPEPVGEGLDTQTAWEQALNKLKDQVGEASYETWLKNTVLLEASDRAARIAVSSPFAVAWLERRLYQPIASALKDILKRDLDLQFITSPASPE